MNGEQSVMMDGEGMMLLLCVDNWDSHQKVCMYVYYIISRANPGGEILPPI